MANKLILKRSSVASKVPLATDLEPGELAVNLTDQKLYSKRSDGTVILVGSGLGGSGDVQGPASSTDNAIVRFDGTNGKVLKNSAATLDDFGNASFNSVSLTTDLAVTHGGTGASDAAGARTNLGAQETLVSGTNIKTINSTSLLGSGDIAIQVFPSGTKMLFAQTAAPTGWTKDTTHNNKALRVVSGTAGSGGSVEFTTAFASKSVSGTLNNVTVTGSVGNTTLAESQMPNHRHAQQGGGRSGGNVYPTYDNAAGVNNTIFTAYVGGGGAHGHSLSLDSHDHTFTGTAINLAVQYVDVIICTKD